MEQSLNMSTLADFIGKEIGVSEWEAMPQSRIDAFAACTGDHQWIHVDPERAQRESPFGSTIAHGFLTLSTLAPHALEILVKPLNARQTVNCGAENVRFISPVHVNARIRTRLTVEAVATKGPGRTLVTMGAVVEIEGQPKPALTANLLFMLFE